MPARVPRLQAQARPKACRVPGTARLARAVPGPWRAVPACSRAGLFSPARLASYRADYYYVENIYSKSGLATLNYCFESENIPEGRLLVVFIFVP